MGGRVDPSRSDLIALTEELVRLGSLVRDAVIAFRDRDSRSDASTQSPGHGDVAYPIDIPAERVVSDFIRSAPALQPIVVTTEHHGTNLIPEGASIADAMWHLIVDPIDGTRELMYDKRSAWFLAGLAPNRPGANLGDIVAAAQVEIPTSTQERAAVLTAIAGRGVTRRWWSRLTPDVIMHGDPPMASTASTVRDGFAIFVDFFPGSHREVGAIAAEVLEAAIGPPHVREAAAFNDQYISTGGQLYLLACGAYRFVADLRPDVDAILRRKGKTGVGLCAHPYDLAAYLTASESGVLLTDAEGHPLSYPLDASTDCSWIGYANQAIREQVEPHLHEAIAARKTYRL